MGPAAPEGHVGERLGDRLADAPGAIGDDEAQVVGVEAPPHEGTQEAAPLGRRLGGRLAVVEQFALAGRIDRVGR